MVDEYSIHRPNLGGFLTRCFCITLRWLIIVPGGLITSPRGGPGGPGTGFCSPGGGFSGSRRSGKPLRLLRLKKVDD